MVWRKCTARRNPQRTDPVEEPGGNKIPGTTKSLQRRSIRHLTGRTPWTDHKRVSRGPTPNNPSSVSISCEEQRRTVPVRSSHPEGETYNWTSEPIPAQTVKEVIFEDIKMKERRIWETFPPWYSSSWIPYAFLRSICVSWVISLISSRLLDVWKN